MCSFKNVYRLTADKFYLSWNEFYIIFFLFGGNTTGYFSTSLTELVPMILLLDLYLKDNALGLGCSK
jgi:hypothetical protein